MSHKRTKKEFEEAAKHSYNIAAICRKPGLRFKPSEEKPMSEILVKDSTYQSFKLKRRILKKGLKQHICECCRLSEWQNTPIPLLLHHLNGDNRDNRLENLQLLCPNCHALTESYRGRNKKLS